MTFYVGTGTSVRRIDDETSAELAKVSANYAQHVPSHHASSPTSVFITKRKFSKCALDLSIEVINETVYLEFKEHHTAELVDLMAEFELKEDFMFHVMSHPI